MDLRGASLRMTVLLGGEKQKNIRLGVQKHEKIEKVTGSPTAGRGRQDDGFVGGF
jgi:hypothetical protein